MNTTTRRLSALALVLPLLALPGCGDEPAPDARTDAGGDPSASEVAAFLVNAEDLGDQWTEVTPPDPEVAFEGGVVKDENRDYLPRMEFCPDASAESKEVAGDLQWQAFRQLDYDTGMVRPTAEPTPGSPPPQHHLVFLQEFLLRDAGDVEDLYAAVAAGMEACTGQTNEYPDGETGRSKPLDMPAVGDEATGTREIVIEPGPAKRSATWDLRNMLIRDGEYLVGVTFAEIRSPKVDRQFDDAAIEQLVETVTAQLP